jgi:uncharacterized LabA/DUF88 family protein
MDRCGIFVDAGYLIAEGAKACIGGNVKRGDIAIDYARLIGRLCKRATVTSGLPVLRVYWYDGAVDGVPTTEQHFISTVPDVKLRLGRLSGDRQKGVDALVYRDLSVLARERAIVTAYLLTGDEDFREGVAAAQELGVHVTLWGIGVGNQARTLMAEVDRCERLDDCLDLFAPALGSQFALARQVPGMAEPSGCDEEAVRAAALSFVQTWTAEATPEDIGDLLAVRPRIPAALDAELLRTVQARQGDLRKHDDLRYALRAAFWEGVESTLTHQQDDLE